MGRYLLPFDAMVVPPGPAYDDVVAGLRLLGHLSREGAELLAEAEQVAGLAPLPDDAVWIKCNEAAARLRLHPRSVQIMAKQNKLTSRFIGRALFLLEADVEAECEARRFASFNDAV